MDPSQRTKCTVTFIALNVTECPLVIKKALKDQKVTEKEPVTFTCEMSKSNQPVQWLKDGKPIRHGIKYKISSDGATCTLTIPKPVVEDSAKYTIKLGNVFSTGKLVVTGERFRNCDERFFLRNYTQ